MKKRITALVMTAVMTISTISCGKIDNSMDTYQYRGVDISGEPVTITYLTIGDKPINGMTEQVVDKLNEILLKKANAKLDIYYIGWNDYLENYNHTLDMVSVNLDLVATGSDWLDAWPNAVKGNFMPLTEEMLQKCCPQTYKNVSAKEWRCCSYNDKIYFIPENEYTQWINHGFVYRGDIARDAGLDSITSWSDLDKYFKYLTTSSPVTFATDFAASWLSSFVFVCPSKIGSRCLMATMAVIPFLVSAPVKFASFSFRMPNSFA